MDDEWEPEPSRDLGRSPWTKGHRRGVIRRRRETIRRRCCSPGVIGNEKKHLSLQFMDPPRPRGGKSSRIPYVIVDALPTGRFFLRATDGYGVNGAYYVCCDCDARTRVATPLPPSGSLEQLNYFPRRSVGFMEDSRHRGYYLVVAQAQLHPTWTTNQHETLVNYSPRDNKWDVK